MAIITKNWPNGDKLTLTTGVSGIAVSSDPNMTVLDRQMNVTVKTTGHTPATRQVLVKQRGKPQPIVIFEANSKFADVLQTLNRGPGNVNGTANGHVRAQNDYLQLSLVGQTYMGLTVQTRADMSGFRNLVFEMEQIEQLDLWDYDVRLNYGVANRNNGSLSGGARQEHGKFSGEFRFPLGDWQGYYYPSASLQIVNQSKTGTVRITKIWLEP